MTSEWAAILVTVLLGIAGNWWQIKDAKERRATDRAAEQKALDARLNAIEKALAVQEEWERSMRETARELKAVVEVMRERRR